MNIFENASWIWHEKESNPDSYGEFVGSFSYNSGNAVMRVSCDSNFALYLNGVFVTSGQYPDFPKYKIYEEIDLTCLCKKGENHFTLLVWYYGIDCSQTYFLAPAGVIFELSVDGKAILSSGINTLCRKNEQYANGACKLITSQLGLSFAYDANRCSGEFHTAFPAPVREPLLPRPIPRLTIGDRAPVAMEKHGEGHYLIDLGHESCGFLDLEFTTEKENHLIIAYGEHIVDGCVRRRIHTRDFSVDYTAAPGKNTYFNPFRRLGGRYLEVFCDSEIDIDYIGIRPVDFPVSIRPFDLGDDLRNKIYATCIDTLRLCMHDHYEDTPWREQALYAMDSRNQMLCGYQVFNEIGEKNADGTPSFDGYLNFARANLIMLAKGVREDGLLSICAPTTFDWPIPSFSLIYPVQIMEYIEYSGDKSILDYALPVIEGIFRTLTTAIDETGLIARLPKPFWNFYEWVYGSHGTWKDENGYDLILNAMFIYSAEYYKKLAAMTGTSFDFDLDSLRAKVHDTFYDRDRGLFKAVHGSDEAPVFYTKLGNAFALLADVASPEEAAAICTQLCDFERVSITGDGTDEMIDTTLSMRAFLYDAILRTDPSRAATIVADIDKKYTYMLNCGATSFWETILGEADFENAGSLCHGWSAIPIHYYNKLLR